MRHRPRSRREDVAARAGDARRERRTAAPRRARADSRGTTRRGRRGQHHHRLGGERLDAVAPHVDAGDRFVPKEPDVDRADVFALLEPIELYARCDRLSLADRCTDRRAARRLDALAADAELADAVGTAALHCYATFDASTTQPSRTMSSTSAHAHRARTMISRMMFLLVRGRCSAEHRAG